MGETRDLSTEKTYPGGRVQVMSGTLDRDDTITVVWNARGEDDLVLIVSQRDGGEVGKHTVRIAKELVAKHFSLKED